MQTRLSWNTVKSLACPVCDLTSNSYSSPAVLLLTKQIKSLLALFLSPSWMSPHLCTPDCSLKLAGVAARNNTAGAAPSCGRADRPRWDARRATTPPPTACPPCSEVAQRLWAGLSNAAQLHESICLSPLGRRFLVDQPRAGLRRRDAAIPRLTEQGFCNGDRSGRAGARPGVRPSAVGSRWDGTPCVLPIPALASNEEWLIARTNEQRWRCKRLLNSA